MASLKALTEHGVIEIKMLGLRRSGRQDLALGPFTMDLKLHRRAFGSETACIGYLQIEADAGRYRFLLWYDLVCNPSVRWRQT